MRGVSGTVRSCPGLVYLLRGVSLAMTTHTKGSLMTSMAERGVLGK